jgi:hypothetical protein
MRSLMRAMRVARVEFERAFDERDARRQITGLDIRPAEISQEPPILGPMRRQFLQ